MPFTRTNLVPGDGGYTFVPADNLEDALADLNWAIDQQETANANVSLARIALNDLWSDDEPVLS